MTPPRHHLLMMHPGGEPPEPPCSSPCFPQYGFPPEISAAAGDFVTLAALGQVAERVTDERLRGEMQQGLQRSLAKLIDEYAREPMCSWLGTQTEAVSLLGALGVAAQSFANPAMRDSVLAIAAQLVQRSSGDRTKT
jgi:hypothetical protein